MIKFIKKIKKNNIDRKKREKEKREKIKKLVETEKDNLLTTSCPYCQEFHSREDLNKNLTMRHHLIIEGDRYNQGGKLNFVLCKKCKKVFGLKLVYAINKYNPVSILWKAKGFSLTEKLDKIG